jgi:hypothetical protein
MLRPSNDCFRFSCYYWCFILQWLRKKFVFSFYSFKLRKQIDNWDKLPSDYQLIIINDLIISIGNLVVFK